MLATFLKINAAKKVVKQKTILLIDLQQKSPTTLTKIMCL
jgi:hypothetical protein